MIYEAPVVSLRKIRTMIYEAPVAMKLEKKTIKSRKLYIIYNKERIGSQEQMCSTNIHFNSTGDSQKGIPIH